MTKEELAKAIRDDYERKGVWAIKTTTLMMKLDFEMLGIILEALEESNWIPVSKRLPEDYKIVIASVDHQFVYPEARYSKEDGWEWAYESGADYWVKIRGDVDAWMSLPKAYKPESEGYETNRQDN